MWDLLYEQPPDGIWRRNRLWRRFGRPNCSSSRQQKLWIRVLFSVNFRSVNFLEVIHSSRKFLRREFVFSFGFFILIQRCISCPFPRLPNWERRNMLSSTNGVQIENSGSWKWSSNRKNAFKFFWNYIQVQENFMGGIHTGIGEGGQVLRFHFFVSRINFVY